MKGIKGLWIFIIGAATLIQIQARADQERCFPASVVEQLAGNFSQLSPYVDRSKTEICESQLGAQWATVVETLIDLKDIRLSDEISYPTKDDFSFKAIPDNGWWQYFIERADQFQLMGSHCSPQVVAYVTPFLRGVVNLCDAFYKENRIARAETLLHEVRHFEGYGHVTCSHGADKGTSGACDDSLPEKGSYAVSMQAEITLGLRGKTFSEAEKALGRAQALYLLQNRFNEPTDVKIRESLYLESADGKVYDWAPQESQAPKAVIRLKEPARIYTSSLDTIIYPLDLNTPAYRMSEDFSSQATQIGMYADAYNKKSPTERAGYKALGYQTDGGILTDGGISTLCGNGFMDIKAGDFAEPINTIVTLEKEVQNPVNLFAGASGKLYRLECNTYMGVQLKPLDSYVPANLKRAFIVGEKRYALTDDGQIFELIKNGNQYELGQDVKFSGINENWIEMAVRTMPYLFDDAKNAQTGVEMGEIY